MNSIISILQKLFSKELDLLTTEINAYPTEESLWGVDGNIKNPGGNLCLHLCGNLQHFVGNVLGKTDYVRNREAEFADKNVPKATLLQQIQTTKESVKAALAQLPAEKLNEEYPIQVFGEPMTTEYFLTHLLAHLSYHRGQINYHRRLLGER
ncbi:MAG: DinB family protein [Cyclobacteriaceae bacterium]|nr:DinB family protein [Cyclobacteriaceae bacterium]